MSISDCGIVSNKIPISLRPLVAALDHHRAEYHLCLPALETYASIHIPASHTNGSSEPGVKAAQNCSGDAVERAGVSAVHEVVDARRADF